MIEMPTIQEYHFKKLEADLREEVKRLRALCKEKDGVIQRLKKDLGISKNDVFELIETGTSDADIAAKLGVSKSTIYRCRQAIKNNAAD